MTNSTATVLDDLAAIRTELRDSGEPSAQLLRLDPALPLLDIASDWAVIALAALACTLISPWLFPLAVLLVGNRQRSLGNILHDGSHWNLHRQREVNDTIARVLIAPLLFVDLDQYRGDHFRHHAQLGDPAGDPDLLAPRCGAGQGWLNHYAAHVLDKRRWWDSVASHLGQRGTSWSSRLTIVAWWIALAAAIDAAGGVALLCMFMLLWLLARATAFHLITTFREMCDHFGMKPGGVCSFTRDIVTEGPWAWLLHPRNNGLHLTHHLLPTVPYYRLRQAQRLLSRLPTYRSHSPTRASYVFGRSAVVAGWARGAAQ
ncbi:MAG TPA: fatty acid desaturase [Burkholderiaceae bacterium]|nr:fatty acid desaturase [Burkholderiaceae bacterium]